jgi:tripartite-type tricarboxylate transporter receptor subunit TctC
MATPRLVLPRRRLLLSAGAAGLTRPALTQGGSNSWPTRPVRVVVPFGGGGGST